MSLLRKLKDGIEDAVAFLQALEQFQIPAAMERRRMVLVEKLESLHGELLKDSSLPRAAVREKAKGQEEKKTKKRASSVGALGGFLKRAKNKEQKIGNSDALEQESKAEEGVPTITVELEQQLEDGNEQEVDVQKKQKGGNLKSKRQSLIPEQGVQKNGYAYRKGRKKWEKCYCVLSYSALYFTTSSDNKEYTHVLHIVDQKGSIKQEEKGHDKNAHSLLIKIGGKKEQLSLESRADCESWYRTLEQVMGLSGIEELALEDEDLYDDLEPPPPLPTSPRPPHKSQIPAETGTNSRDTCDEDIYEEFDDIGRQDILSNSFSPEHPPTLPPRNELAPKLPPRNSLSPREVLKKSPTEAPPVSSSSESDEELYSDIVPGQDRMGEEDEDLYVENGFDSPVDQVDKPHDEELASDDLYEDFNDKRQDSSASPPPSLPPRTETAPKLPPRNSPTSLPALPPRVRPQKGSVEVPPRSPPTGINAEQHSGTVPGQEDEGEDLYVDNVVTPPKVDKVEESHDDKGHTSDKVRKRPLRRKPVLRNKSLLDLKQQKPTT